jgi:hypothetical protein
MEKFSDYKMVDDRPVVEQDHEIHILAKEIEGFKRELPDKFLVGSTISKLPPFWRDFATSLKHKRQLFNIAGLIGPLDVEDKARAKDTRGKEIVGASSKNFVQKKIISATPMARRRTTSLKMLQRLNRQPPLRRRRRMMVIAMCAVNLDTLLESAQIAKALKK